MQARGGGLGSMLLTLYVRSAETRFDLDLGAIGCINSTYEDDTFKTRQEEIHMEAICRMFVVFRHV